LSQSIDQAFVKQFEADVFVAYQRMGSKIRGTVRTVNGVQGQDTTFFKVGKGSASTKSRHGVVPTMNASHSSVTCTLADYYAGDWIDKLDLLKTNINERQVVASTGAYALGRKTDDLIKNAMTAVAGTTIAVGGTGLDKTKFLTTLAAANSADIPDDGNRYLVVAPQGWNNLMSINEFVSADYVGYDQQPWAVGLTAKRWNGVNIYMFTGLDVSALVRSAFFYHSAAVGHAIGQDVMTDVTWHGDRAAWFVNNMMSMGAVGIDGTGVIKVNCQEV
jgi:hypothetical protein